MMAFESEIVTLPQGPARVEWRRSARARRVSLRIDPRGGAVIVTLPPRAGRRAGMALLVGHAGWVADRLAALPRAVAFSDGESVPLHGAMLTIRHTGTARGTVRVEDGALLVSGDPRFLARRVADFYRAEARRTLGADVAAICARAGLRPGRITVKDTRSRWGSCAANGDLAFSWRLVMAPRFVQEYVAAHEAAHLRHMNHGHQFWALLATLTEHTQVAMRWLRTEGPRLLRTG